jgi:hypothetical protein
MLIRIKGIILVFSLFSLFLSTGCTKDTSPTGSRFDSDLLYRTWNITDSYDDVIVLWPYDLDQPLPRFPLHRLYTFNEDHTMIQYGFGPAYEPLQFSGVWSFTGNNRIAITFDKDQSSHPEDYEIEILLLEENQLKIRKIEP